MCIGSVILFVFGGLWCQNDNLEMRKGTKKECVVNARHTPQTSRWTNHPSFVKQPTKYILFVEYSLLYLININIPSVYLISDTYRPVVPPPCRWPWRVPQVKPRSVHRRRGRRCRAFRDVAV